MPLFTGCLKGFLPEEAGCKVYALYPTEAKGGSRRAEFSRWAGAKHQDRHDEGRARRHVVLGGRRRGAPDIPRRRGQIAVGDMRTGSSPSRYGCGRSGRTTSVSPGDEIEEIVEEVRWCSA